MPKQLNVNLAFNADIKQAQAQIAQLQKSLDSLMSGSIKNSAFTGFDKNISEAQQSILKLKGAINDSLNMDTGRLDLSKFNAQLNNSGLSLSKLATDMSAMGADGQKAFLNLANSIVTAQKPMLETNKLLDNMWTALKNTARWQLSSSLLHGFMGAIQGAYGYAQDLNASLTDIAIVTGRSTDQMAEFAEQANKSAQALSVSTTAYTDAALIYYQQGLNDEEVKARTDVTMMMSNVTGQSAEKVSSYMTAIWNNFAEGSDNLTYFADVITALGAATASSSEEIANGMQQFAAVADTVGLSYEYAATALATVVAQTRQSESTVGNSFRTIFSRLQGLKLGDTLDDGTTLNKYSAALASVGVNIKDQNGDLKDMDTILNEIGAKWQTLAKDQQIALAQTVGGVRQYTNLVALFDNWDKFQENLEVAYGSEGTLEEQADIYAESWEAAQKRVKAAWQGIFQDLIDDKFFIWMLNGLADILKGVDTLIDSLGGLPGVLSAIGAIAFSAFGEKMIPSIEKAQLQLSKILTPLGGKETYAEMQAQALRKQAVEEAEKMQVGSMADHTVLDNLKQQIQLYDKLANLKKSLTKEEFALYQQLVANTGEYAKQAEAAIKAQQAAQVKANDSTSVLKDRIYLKDDLNGYGEEAAIGMLGRFQDQLSNFDTNPIAKMEDELSQSKAIEKLLNKWETFRKQIGATREELRQFIVDQTALAKAIQTQQKATAANEGNSVLIEKQLKYKQLLSESKTEEEALKEIVEGLTEEEKEKLGIWQEEKAIQKEIVDLQKEYNEAVENMDNEKVQQITEKFAELGEKLEAAKQKAKESFETSIKTPQPTQEDGGGVPEVKKPFFLEPQFAKDITTAFRGVSQLTMGITSLSTAMNILNDNKLEPMEKLEKALPSLLMGLPMVVTGFTSLASVIPGVTAAVEVLKLNIFNLSGAWTALMAGGFGWFLLAAVAIGGLIAAVVSANNELHATEIAAEKAAEKAEESKEKFDEMKTAFDQLKSSLENHKAAVDALEDLKRGTEEWRNAVFDLNQDTLELLKQYPELAKYVENVNGALVISEKGMKEFESKKRAELAEGYETWIGDQEEAYTTDIANKKHDLAGSISYGQPEMYGVQPTAADSDITKVMALIDKNANLLNATKDDWIKALSEEGISNELLAEALYNNRDSIGDLLAEERSNTNAISGLRESLYASSVDDLFGDKIAEKVGNDAFVGPVEDYLAQLVIEAEEKGISLEQALLNLQKDFAVNSEQYIKDALQRARENVTQDLIESRDLARITPEQIESNVSELDDNTVAIMARLKPEHGETWDEYMARVEEEVEKHHLDIKINADDLTQFKGKTEDLQVEVEKLSGFLQKNWADFEGLSEHLEECKAAADKVAYSFIRFDDAMQDVSKNYKKWKKQLESEDVTEVSEAVDELRKTYGNLLDIDGAKLGDDFLEDSKNLELLNEVLNGTEEEAIAAYDALERAAMLSEFKKFGIQVDEDSFNSAYDLVNQKMEELGILAGEDLQAGTVEFDQMADALDAMLAMVGDDKEAAEALMDAMNWEGELTNQPAEADDNNEQQDHNAYFTTETATAKGFNTGSGDGDDMVMTAGNEVEVQAPSLHYEVGKASKAHGKKHFNVQSYHINRSDGKTLHYNGGGAPKIRNMPARNLSNGSGGSCFAAGTIVALNNYYKNIEDIKIGDIVLSYNEKTKKNEYSKVIQTMIHNVYEKIYDLFIKNDKLVVTGNHRFLITRNNKQKWVQAADIQIGDYVLLADGSLYKISKINIQTRFLTVYNFEVSNTHNYYVGESQVLAHNKGGGGGGGSKPKKKKVEKKKEPTKNIKEADRYHNIKEKIEDLNAEMKRLNENKDRAYGKDRIKWMDEEIKKTEEQIKLTDEYIKEIKDYAKIDKEDLKTKLGSDFISDADFDENGVLKDYEGLLAKIQGAFDDNVTAALNKATEEYNKAVDAFNESDQGDEATEEFDKAKEAWDKAKESYDKDKATYDERIKALKQYEDTINLLQEKEQERIDQLNELYDRWLERTEYKVEISLDMNDKDRKLLDWIYNHLGDKADKAADRIANLGQQMKTNQKDIATYVKGIEELFAQNGMKVNLDKDNLDGQKLGEELNKMIEKLRADGSEPNIQKVIDKMTEYRDGLMDTYDTMRDVVDQVTENVVNAYDEWNEKLQENLDLMDHYDTVIDTIKEIADLLGEDQLGLGDAQAEAYEASKLKNQQNAAAIAKDNYDAIAAERQKAQEMLDRAESETEKRHWEEVLKNLEESEKEAMEEYLARWRDALRQAEENYQASLERNEKAYQKTMSGGLGTLDKLQEQLDRQKELNNLYLDGYEKYKKLGDLTANINKSLANNPNVKVQEKMKDLLDDVNAKMEAGAEISEGEATILEKRLALLEAENQLQEARNAKSAVRMTRDNEGNFSYTYTADTSKIEEAQQNYADKFYDLLDYERQYADETQANMLKSWQDFIDKRNDILNDDMLSEEERNKALERLKGDYDELVSYYADELGMVMDEMGRLKTEDWKDMEAILGRLLAAPEDFQTNYQDTVLGKITNAWQNPEDLKDSWVGAVNSLYEADTAARNKWIASNEETNRRVDTSTREFADNYVGTLGEVVEASNEVAKSAEDMAQSMGPAMDKVLGEAKDFFSEIGLYMDNLVENIKSIVSAINDLQGVLAGIDPEWQSKILGKLPEGSEKSNMAGYDTGGYTGEWGSSGKLAVLHQKELVLNAFDTSNILKAVDLIRNIPSFGTNVNINHNIDYGSLAAVGATDLQQQVHIDASFPNVQSHTEIELALNNLINSASQYVNRKS